MDRRRVAAARFEGLDRRDLALHRGGRRTRPRGPRGRRRPRRRRRAQGLRRGALAAPLGLRAGRPDGQAPGRAPEPRRRPRDDHHRRDGLRRSPSPTWARCWPRTSCSPTTRSSRGSTPSRRSARACSGPALVRQEPVGVVAGIVPWNVPLFVTMLKLAPALASGSTIVLKPAPETPLDAYLLAAGARGGGHPEGRRQHRARRARGRRAPRDPPGHRQGRLHRQHRRGQAHRGPLRRAAAARDPRARRQVGGDPARRRRSRRGDARPAAGLHHEQRPGLRRADAHPRAPRALRARSSTPSPRPSAR